MKLAIVAPCYNESEVLLNSVERLTRLMDDLVAKEKITADSFILLVNDGSRDNTWELIYQLFKTNHYIYGINLAANVGHQYAIMAGMMTAKDRSDAVITIDVDLQDDLNAIEKMVDNYANGYDIVYGVKVSRQADPFIKRCLALSFYKLQQMMGMKSIYNHADFRLMSTRAVNQLSHFTERNLYLRGIVPLIGYPSTTVDDVISLRTAGESKYTFKKMMALALDGITSFSTKPISLILGVGFVFLLISLVMTVYVLCSYCKHLTVPGWSSLMLSVWFVGSIVLLSIGVVGQYIGKIYIEVKNRPRYNIETFLSDKEEISKLK
ncbi:MAG: glycosyltransferase family 2 protein [Alistipes sp.]